MFDFATIFMLIRITIVGVLLWMFYRMVRSGIARVWGDGEREKHWRGQLIGFIIAFILLWPATGFRLEQRYREWRYRPQLYMVAQQLGYTPEDLLIEDSGCWDPVMTFYPLATERCEIFLYFTTELAPTDIESLVTHFPAGQIARYMGNESFSSTFTRLNQQTSASLQSDNPWQPLLQHRWQFHGTTRNFELIEWYATSEISGIIFDGKEIKKNIVRIDVTLGNVHLY